MQSPHDALRRNILSLSKQLHQALVFGEDTDVIYLFILFLFFFSRQDKTFIIATLRLQLFGTQLARKR